VRVEVRLFATFARYLPKDERAGSASLDVAEGSTAGDVGRALGIPAHLSRIILVNDQEVDEHYPLRPEDVVTLFPPLAGGGAVE
jgi:molybdopterin converting factor small subunit